MKDITIDEIMNIISFDLELYNSEYDQLEESFKKFLKNKEDDSWTKEDAQPAGGGFTTEEILNSQRENW